MRWISPTVFILGLIMASAIEENTTGIITTVTMMNSTMTSMSGTEPRINTSTSTNTTMTMNDNITVTTNPTAPPPTPPAITPEGNRVSPAEPPSTISPAPPGPLTAPPGPPPAPSTTKTTPEDPGTSDNTGIIIIIVIVIAAVVLAVACYVTRKKARRYSVDLGSKPEDAQIPLSTMEADAHVENVSRNGMQTFTGAEPDTTGPEEPVEKPEGLEEQKAEADQAVDDAGPDPAALDVSPDGSVDKVKEDTAESTPAAPVEQSLEEKTEDEPNKNNSNNAATTGAAARDWQPSHVFSDVPLDSPV